MKKSNVRRPLAKEEMTKKEMDAMLQKGLQEAKEGKGDPAKEVFEILAKSEEQAKQGKVSDARQSLKELRAQLHIPNEVTRQAIEEGRKMARDTNVKGYTDINKMFEDILGTKDFATLRAKQNKKSKK